MVRGKWLMIIWGSFIFFPKLSAWGDESIANPRAEVAIALSDRVTVGTTQYYVIRRALTLGHEIYGINKEGDEFEVLSDTARMRVDGIIGHRGLLYLTWANSIWRFRENESGSSCRG